MASKNKRIRRLRAKVRLLEGQVAELVREPRGRLWHELRPLTRFMDQAMQRLWIGQPEDPKKNEHEQ
jgi:hypothetical protein